MIEIKEKSRKQKFIVVIHDGEKRVSMGGQMKVRGERRAEIKKECVFVNIQGG